MRVVLAFTPSPTGPPHGSAGSTASGVFFFVVLIAAVVGLVLWVNRETDVDRAKKRAAAMTDGEVRRLDRDILGHLYRRSTDEPTATDVATAIDRDPADVRVALHRLITHEFVRRADATAGNGVHEVAERATIPAAGQKVRLTPAGAAQFSTRGDTTVNGDMISAGDGAVVTNRSIVTHSFNAFAERYSTDVADALTELERVVRESGSADGAEQLAEFLAQLDTEQPKKSVLRALFTGITEAVPAVTALAQLTATIGTLFA